MVRLLLMLANLSPCVHALPWKTICDRRLVAAETEWRGNVAYPKRFGPKTLAEIMNEHQIVTLNEPHASMIFDALITDLTEIDPRAIDTVVDVRWHVWTWTAASPSQELDVWFQRDEDLKATRAFVRRSRYTQILIVTSPERLAALEKLVRVKMTPERAKIEDDPRIFVWLPAPTSGYVL